MSKIITDQYKNIDHTKYSFLNNKTVLITGANGLIGLNLLSMLIHLKKFFSIDIICSVNSKPETYTQSLFDNCLTFIGDLTNSSTISKIEDFFAERSFGADIIFHTAGYAQPSKFTANKIETIQLNTTSIIELFRLLNTNGIFFYCSSSEIYSGLETKEITEDQIGTTNPLHHRSCYIESKRCGETICLSMSDKFNIKIGRISTTYGPGAKIHDTRVISSLINKGIDTGIINLIDDGASLRTICYISDLTQMIMNIVGHGKEKIYNITGYQQLTIKDIAKIIGNKLSCNITYGTSSMIGNPSSVSVSITRYENEFGKLIEIPVFEGLENTILWSKFIRK